MPKELIYSREALDPRDDLGPYPVEHLAVGWTKAPTGVVQVGLTAGPSATIRIDEGATVGDTNSLWLDLDRAQINMLIRSLRKARDAAYGSDA